MRQALIIVWILSFVSISFAQRDTDVRLAVYAGGNIVSSTLTISSTSWSTDAGTITLSATVPAGTDTGYIVTDTGSNSYIIRSFSGAVLTCQDFDSTTDPVTGGATSIISVPYATVTLAEADLDDTIIFRSGDTATILLYSGGGAFDEALTKNGGGTVGLTSVEITAPISDRGDGTANTGTRLLATVGRTWGIQTPDGFNNNYTISWLEFDQNGNDSNMFEMDSQDAGDVGILRNLLVHDQSGGNARLGFVSATVRDVLIMNSIFYDNTRNGAATFGLDVDADLASGGVLNCIVFNVDNASATGVAAAIKIQNDDADGRIRNNICMATTTGGSGAATDFDFAGSTNLTSSNNMSEDATADDGGGSNHQISKTVANQFVSSVDPKDLHIQDTNADSFEAGVDLVITPTNINFDINNFNRNAGPTAWSIGADDGNPFRGAIARRRIIRSF